MPVYPVTQMILSDESLKYLLLRGEMATATALPRKTFAAVCLQAMRKAEDDPAQALMSAEEIKDLLIDPNNATVAALSADTLRKLCLQALDEPGHARV